MSSRCRLPNILCALALGLAASCVHAPGVGLFGSDDADVSYWEGIDYVDKNQWYFQRLEDTTCANGTSTGLGVNVGESQRDVVIYLSGGGACWDDRSCRYFQTAANLDVIYDSDQLSKELTPLVEAGLFDRDADVNPLPDASYAYIPYCTADLHTGRKTTSYEGFGGGEDIRHHGFYNLQAYLDVLPRYFPNAERVWLIGISAGGYGITWNFDHIRAAFPDAEMHVFSDASPWIPIEDDRWELWKRNWGLETPEGCDDCNSAPGYLPAHLAATYPETRFAMSVFSRDSVLSAYMGVLPGEVESAVAEFVEKNYDGDNTRAFVADGAKHETLLELSDGVKSKEGIELSDFLRQWIAGW